MHHRYLTSALFFSGVLALVRSAEAGDKESAKASFDRGVERMEAKDYAAACPAIEQSMKLDPYPGTLFTLAECETLRGRAAAALARYGEYLQMYASLPPEKQKKQGARAKEARLKTAELERVVARATFTLPPETPAGTVVARDGVTLAAGELEAPAVLDPGDHVVTTQAPGGPLTEQRFTLGKGEKRTIALEVRRAAGAPAPPSGAPAPAPVPLSGRRVAAFVSGGVGVAGLVLGAVTGGLMLSKKDAISAGCKDTGSGVAACNAEGASAGNSAKMLGAVASAGFVTGLLGAGMAVVLFATAPKRASARAAASGGVEVGVRSLGAAGTSVSVRGSF
jgi:hypothetical protein